MKQLLVIIPLTLLFPFILLVSAIVVGGIAVQKMVLRLGYKAKRTKPFAYANYDNF